MIFYYSEEQGQSYVQNLGYKCQGNPLISQFSPSSPLLKIFTYLAVPGVFNFISIK